MNEYMSLAKFLADDHLRTQPIACRLVPFDQWLVTHVDTSWKVKDIKHWILSKCNAWGTTAAPQPPRFRPASPVTFSAPSRRSASPSSSWGGTVEGDDDEWDGFAAVDRKMLASDSTLGLDASQNSGPGRVLPSSASSPSFYPAPRQFGGETLHGPEQTATSARYTVVSFSNGFILDDEAVFSWYKLRPFELLEIHRAGTIVCLPRQGAAYAEPYFESPIRVSERPHRKKAHSETDQNHLQHSSEWKHRWAVIREGMLHLCKDSQSAPTHKFPISALSTICGPERLGLTTTSSHVVCAKFNRTSGSVGNVEDVDTGPSIGAAAQRNKKGKAGSWVIIEMPDRNAYEHILRVLHRLAPHPMQLSNTKVQTPLHSPSPTSPSTSNTNPSLIPPTSVPFKINTSGLSHTTSSVSTASPTHVPSSTSPAYFGVQYPEWRLAVLSKARMAGWGCSNSAVSVAHANCLVVGGDEITSTSVQFRTGSADPEMFHRPLPRATSISEGLRRLAVKDSQSVSESSDADVDIEDEIENTTGASSSNPSASASPWLDALSEEEEDEDEAEDDIESEIEWEGWVHDLSRRAARKRNAPPFPPCRGDLQREPRSGRSFSRSTGMTMSPSSPSSSDYDYDYNNDTYHHAGGPGRVRTVSYSTASASAAHDQPGASGSGSGTLQRTRSSTTTAGTMFGVHPFTSTTTTVITTYVDHVPDSNGGNGSTNGFGDNASRGERVVHPAATFPSGGGSHSLNTPRGHRVRSSENQSTGFNASSMPTLLSSSPTSGTGGFGGSSGRSGTTSGGLGGVKRIVRGVSIRNAFSAERLTRGFEDALDFVDGRRDTR